MKKLTLITVLVLALTVSGCESIFGSAETPTSVATYTPAPTYTSLPTYTPFPSPTEPAEATATLVPLQSPTAAVSGVTPTDSGAAAGEMTATILNASWVREGPDLTYVQVSHVDAGETVVVLGRDHNGFWLKIRNSVGKEGWVRLTQFVQPIDVRQIPEVTDIPTPSVTVTVRATSTKPGVPPSTPNGTPATVVASASGMTFNLIHGGGPVCSLIGPWYISQAVPIKDMSIGLLPYKPGDQSQVGTTVFELDTSQLPAGLTANIQGNINGNSCTSTCNLVTFTLCATASASLTPGSYNKPVILQFGPYNVNNFLYTSTSGVPTVFNVN